MKDGKSVENGISALLSYPSAPAISLNIKSVSLRVLATIKSFMTLDASIMRLVINLTKRLECKHAICRGNARFTILHHRNMGEAGSAAVCVRYKPN